MNIQMLGVEHGIHQTPNGFIRKLMEPTSEIYFAKDVWPTVTNRSAIIIEGWRGKKNSGDQNYKEIINIIGNSETLSDKSPTIIGCDPRVSESGNSEQFNRHCNDVLKLADFHDRWLEIKNPPATFEEAIEIIKSGSIPLRAHITSRQQLKEISAEMYDTAKKVMQTSEAFDSAHIELLNRISPHYDKCFLIAGRNHCFSIGFKTHWDMSFVAGLQKPDASLKHFFIVQVLPKMICEWANAQ